MKSSGAVSTSTLKPFFWSTGMTRLFKSERRALPDLSTVTGVQLMPADSTFWDAVAQSPSNFHSFALQATVVCKMPRVTGLQEQV